MSSSYTTTSTFTITHARYLASKVATDLWRMHRFYDRPNAAEIGDFQKEITQYLIHGYLQRVYYGFKRSGEWIEPTLVYSASDIVSSADDDPGKIRPNSDISNANFHSFLEHSLKFLGLSLDEQEQFFARLPFRRCAASTPGINGYLETDLTYSAGGRMLARAYVRGYK